MSTVLVANGHHRIGAVSLVPPVTQKTFLNIGPWEFEPTTNGLQPYGWNPPVGTKFRFDLRANSLVTENLGLFLSEEPISGYEQVDFLDEYTPQQAKAFYSRLGIDYRPTAALTFVDMMSLLFSRLSDPVGADSIKAPSINRGGFMSVKLFGRTIRTAFSLEEDTPTRTLLRQTYAKHRQKWIDLGSPEDNQFHRKWLHLTLKKCGRLSGNSYRILQERLPDEGPLKPSTTVNAGLTGDGTGDLDDGPWEYHSGKKYRLYAAGCGNYAGNDGSRAAAAHTTSLSADDHYAEIEWAVNNIASSGPAVRIGDPTSTTLYDNYHTQRFSGQIYVSKVVNGSITNLGNTSQAFSVSDVDRLDIDGSDLEAVVNAVSKVSVSDTALSGQLQVGLMLLAYNAGAAINFEGSDGVEGGSPPQYNFRRLYQTGSL